VDAEYKGKKRDGIQFSLPRAVKNREGGEEGRGISFVGGRERKVVLFIFPLMRRGGRGGGGGRSFPVPRKGEGGFHLFSLIKREGGGKVCLHSWRKEERWRK